MSQESDYGLESGLYRQEITANKGFAKTHLVLVPHNNNAGADLEEQAELLSPLPGEEEVEEEEKDRK